MRELDPGAFESSDPYTQIAIAIAQGPMPWARPQFTVGVSTMQLPLRLRGGGLPLEVTVTFDTDGTEHWTDTTTGADVPVNEQGS
jgi:hypothetical protein